MHKIVNHITDVALNYVRAGVLLEYQIAALAGPLRDT